MAILFVAAFLSSTWQCIRFAGPGFGQYFETTAVARSVASGHGFANPFGSMDTGPTAHLPPAYPLILGTLIRIFGDGPQTALPAILLCTLLQALHTVLLIPLSRMLCRDVRPGFLAAVYTIIVPTIRVLPQFEAIYAATGVMLFCLASARLLSSSRWYSGPAAGVFCGLLLLVNPALISVCALFIAFLLFSKRPPLRSAVVFGAGFTLAAALVCVPWTVRNYRQFGALFFVRDNLGLELYTSNAGCAETRDLDNERNGCHQQIQANQNLAEAKTLIAMGEFNYNRSRMALAREWIRSHPSRFLELTLRRTREFWFPAPEPPAIYSYSLWLITALSVAGVYCMMRERNPAVWFFGAVLIFYPVMYYFVQSALRFRIPVLWITLLPAGIGMQMLNRLWASPGELRQPQLLEDR